MSNKLLCGLALALVGAGYLQAGRLSAASSPGATPPGQTQSSSLTSPIPSSARAVLDRYCVTCHNEKLRTAGLTLDRMDIEHVSDGTELWERVVRKLRSGAMPPPGLPRPDHATSAGLTSWLETALDRSAAAKPNP